jgi:hypothetical protein
LKKLRTLSGVLATLFFLTSCGTIINSSSTGSSSQPSSSIDLPDNVCADNTFFEDVMFNPSNNELSWKGLTRNYDKFQILKTNPSNSVIADDVSSPFDLSNVDPNFFSGEQDIFVRGIAFNAPTQNYDSCKLTLTRLNELNLNYNSASDAINFSTQTTGSFSYNIKTTPNSEGYIFEQDELQNENGKIRVPLQDLNLADLGELYVSVEVIKDPSILTLVDQNWNFDGPKRIKSAEFIRFIKGLEINYQSSDDKLKWSNVGDFAHFEYTLDFSNHEEEIPLGNRSEISLNDPLIRNYTEGAQFTVKLKASKVGIIYNFSESREKTFFRYGPFQSVFFGTNSQNGNDILQWEMKPSRAETSFEVVYYQANPVLGDKDSNYRPLINGENITNFKYEFERTIYQNTFFALRIIPKMSTNDPNKDNYYGTDYSLPQFYSIINWTLNLDTANSELNWQNIKYYDSSFSLVDYPSQNISYEMQWKLNSSTAPLRTLNLGTTNFHSIYSPENTFSTSATNVDIKINALFSNNFLNNAPADSVFNKTFKRTTQGEISLRKLSKVQRLRYLDSQDEIRWDNVENREGYHYQVVNLKNNQIIEENSISCPFPVIDIPCPFPVTEFVFPFNNQARFPTGAYEFKVRALGKSGSGFNNNPYYTEAEYETTRFIHNLQLRYNNGELNWDNVGPFEQKLFYKIVNETDFIEIPGLENNATKFNIQSLANFEELRSKDVQFQIKIISPDEFTFTSNLSSTRQVSFLNNLSISVSESFITWKKINTAQRYTLSVSGGINEPSIEIVNNPQSSDTNPYDVDYSNPEEIRFPINDWPTNYYFVRISSIASEDSVGENSSEIEFVKGLTIYMNPDTPDWLQWDKLEQKHGIRYSIQIDQFAPIIVNSWDSENAIYLKDELYDDILTGEFEITLTPFKGDSLANNTLSSVSNPQISLTKLAPIFNTKYEMNQITWEQDSNVSYVLFEWENSKVQFDSLTIFNKKFNPSQSALYEFHATSYGNITNTVSSSIFSAQFAHGITLRYEDGRSAGDVSWSDLNLGAGYGYVLSILGEEVVRTTATSEIIDPSDYEVGVVGLVVEVYGPNGVNWITNGQGRASLNVTKLGSVSEPDYGGSTVTFVGVSGSEGYEVEYEVSPEANADEFVSGTSIGLGSKAAGYYTIAVTSVGDVNTTMRGETVRVSLVERLSFSYDESSGEFTWDVISNELNPSYSFYVNNVLIETKLSGSTYYDITEDEHLLDYGVSTFSMRLSIPSQTLINDIYQNEIDIVRFGTLTGLSYNQVSNKMVWNSVAFADYYDVFINDVFIGDVDESESLEFPMGGYNLYSKVQILPKSDLTPQIPNMGSMEHVVTQWTFTFAGNSTVNFTQVPGFGYRVYYYVGGVKTLVTQTSNLSLDLSTDGLLPANVDGTSWELSAEVYDPSNQITFNFASSTNSNVLVRKLRSLTDVTYSSTQNIYRLNWTLTNSGNFVQGSLNGTIFTGAVNSNNHSDFNYNSFINGNNQVIVRQMNNSSVINYIASDTYSKAVNLVKIPIVTGIRINTTAFSSTRTISVRIHDLDIAASNLYQITIAVQYVTGAAKTSETLISSALSRPLSPVLPTTGSYIVSDWQSIVITVVAYYNSGAPDNTDMNSTTHVRSTYTSASISRTVILNTPPEGTNA